MTPPPRMEYKPAMTYTDREIEEWRKDVAGSLERIETQTIRTNGRVTSLEKGKYITIGAVGVLTSIVVPILAWALWVLVNIQGQVQEAVHTAISTYDVTVRQ